MELTRHSPFFDLFRRGGVPRDVRLTAARGTLELPAREQLGLLAMLVGDTDEEVAAAASATVDAIPRAGLAMLLALPDTPSDLRHFFHARGFEVGPLPAASGTVAPGPPAPEEPLFRADDEFPEIAVAAAGEACAPGDEAAADDHNGRPLPVTMLPVIERIKLAVRGTREQRALLIRDTNRLVAAAVLSSPKLTDSEVEGFARMANVSEDVLRAVGTARSWVKSYAVASALVKNPKTPAAISMPLVSRLHERDLKTLSIDRNVPEGLRITARKQLLAGQARRR
jgi:hypothetical protein